MKTLSWITALLIAVSWLVGCDDKEDQPEQSLCQKLVAREVECNFKDRSSISAEAKQALVSNCEGKQGKVGMRTAIECDRMSKDCHRFLTCRKQCTELPGGK
jgi:hypothetical protein